MPNHAQQGYYRRPLETPIRIQCTPVGLENASCYPNLVAGLLERGLDETDVERVLGGNMRRAFAAATGEGTRAFDATLVPLTAT